MPDLDSFVDAIDRLTRRLMRNMECCDRALMLTCDLTAAQAYALLAIDELEATTMSELATAMRLHGTTMTRMVDALVERGLATRVQDQGDRRIVRVQLTARGLDTTQSLKDIKRQFLSAAYGNLTEDERTVLLRALEQLTATAETLSNNCCPS